MEELQRRWLVRMEQQSLDFLQDDQAQLDFIEDYCDAQLQLAIDWGDDIDWDPPDEPPTDGPTKRRLKQMVWWLLGQAGFQILWELLTGLVPRVAVCRRSEVPSPSSGGRVALCAILRPVSWSWSASRVPA